MSFPPDSNVKSADQTENIRSVSSLNVSVIIPAHNAAGTIAETLESLLAQTFGNWEAVVVDDGSTDTTAKIVTKFVEQDNRIRMISQPQHGEAGARNAGLPLAHFDWLLFLDADDWISPSHLERMTNELLSNPELDAVHCGSARVALDGTLVTESYLPPKGDMFATLAQRAAFPVHACLVRKSLVESVGRFDTSLVKSPDWDLWQRIARTGARFGAVREVLAFYRMQPNAASLDAFQMFKDGLRVLKQGHAPDARVSHPHPDHANGLPPENIQSQEFYLLCWCAGLLLGTGKDARPLLELSSSEHDHPELYPDAVARCIFDAAPLPTCRPPVGWEELAQSALGNADLFLAALETKSMASNLASLAGTELRKMILNHSPIWKPVIEDYDRRIEDLKQANDQLEVRIKQAWELLEREQKEKASLEELAEERRLRFIHLRRKFLVRAAVRLHLLKIPKSGEQGEK